MWSLRLLPPYIFIAVGSLVEHSLGLRVQVHRLWVGKHQEKEFIPPSAIGWLSKHLRSTVALQLSPDGTPSTLPHKPIWQSPHPVLCFQPELLLPLSMRCILFICLCLPVEYGLSEGMNLACPLVCLQCLEQWLLTHSRHFIHEQGYLLKRLLCH